jgi:hypothetical protein
MMQREKNDCHQVQTGKKGKCLIDDDMMLVVAKGRYKN